MHASTVWMHTSLRAWVVLCTQIGLVWFPNFTHTFHYPIQPNFAEIWAQACKHIVCMHTGLQALFLFCVQTCLAYSPDSKKYLDLSDPTQFGWDMSLCTQAQSIHAHKFACLGQIMCSERSSIISWFHRYFDPSDLTQFGWDMGLSTPQNSVHAW